jgi:hypothetical protein
MNWKTTLVLAILAVGGGIAVLLTSNKSATTTTTEEPEKTERTSIFEKKPEKESFVKVSLERPGQPRLAFQRSGEKGADGKLDSWTMVEPAPGAADANAVDSLVVAAIDLEPQRSFKAGQKGTLSAADAGFDAPQAVFTLVDKLGKETKLEVGKRAPLSNSFFVRLSGQETIHEVQRDLTYDIKKNPSDFRRKSPFTIARNDARNIKIEHDGKTYDLTRNDQGEWVFSSPFKAFAAKDKVSAIVNSLAQLHIDKFVDDAPASLAQFGLEKPWLRIAVTTVEKKLKPSSQPAGSSQPAAPEFEDVTKTHELLVGGAADATSGTRFVKLPDQTWVGSIPSSKADSLIPKDLRDPSVTRVSAAAISQLDITVGESSATLKKTEGGWKGDGDLTDVDVEAVQTLLDTLTNLKAVEFVDDPDRQLGSGLDKPRATITATVAGAVEPVTLHIGLNTRSDRNTWARAGSQPGAVVVSADMASKLIVEPISLRSRTMFSLQPHDIRRVEQQRSETLTVIERAGEDWKLLQPEGAPIDAGGASEVSRDLASMRAKKVVSKGEFEKYGVDKPIASVRFTVAPPAASQPASTQAAEAAPVAAAAEPVTHTVTIGRTPGGFFARKDEEPYVFQLDQTVFESLTGELIRRKLFDFEAKAVSGIKVESNNGMVEFALQDGKWTFPPDSSVKPVQSKVTAFAADLANLRVDQYVAWQADDLSKFGLGEGAVTVSIQFKSGDPITLKIDQMKRGELPRMAIWNEKQRVFLLRTADAEKIIRGLDWYLKEEAPAPEPQPGRPPNLPPGLPEGDE